MVCGSLDPAPETMQIVREYIYPSLSKTNLAIVTQCTLYQKQQRSP